MNVRVRMIAFGNGAIRTVSIPNWDETKSVESKLESVFHYGQNEIQPKRSPSVSVGDVIELDGKLHLVCGAGFREMSEAEYDQYAALDDMEKIRHRWKAA
jgi:hypothetical protein